MKDLRQLGYIGKNVQGNRVYDANGIGTTIAAQTGGLGSSGVGLYLINESEEIGNMTKEQFDNELQDNELKSFTYASAFAGIGGMTLGLKPLGGVGVAAWEYDPTEKRTQYAQDAHRLLHPEIPLYGDICEAKPEELPDFDVFCFTQPCQAFSIAGKRMGFEDTRGTLTFEALRIAKEKQPKILFMENVKGLINHDKGNTMGTIVRAINDIGYTVDFTILNSKYFDVAQNRERVYLIAIRDDLITPEPWIDVKGTTTLLKAKRRYQEEGVRTFNFDWPQQTKVRTRLRDFLEEVVDEKYYLSEDKTAVLVAKLSEENGRKFNEPTTTRIVQLNGDRDKPGLSTNEESAYCIPANPMSDRGQLLQEVDNVNQDVVEHTDRIIEVGKIKPHRNSSLMNTVHDVNGISSTLDTMQGGGREPKILEDSPIMLGHVELNGHDLLKRVYDANAICPTLTSMGGGNTEPKIAEEVLPCLTPERLEKRQNGPRFKADGSEAHTITTIDRHGVAIGKFPKYRIRKLTPRECLRLQAIPEEVIDILLDNFSNSRCYKFAGNGLTINVIEAIGERLVRYL